MDPTDSSPSPVLTSASEILSHDTRSSRSSPVSDDTEGSVDGSHLAKSLSARSVSSPKKFPHTRGFGMIVKSSSYRLSMEVYSPPVTHVAPGPSLNWITCTSQ